MDHVVCYQHAFDQIQVFFSCVCTLVNPHHRPDCLSGSVPVTIEMDEILAEVQSSVQQSAQVRDPNSEYQNVLQRFSQAIDFSDPTKEIRLSDLEKYLNDPTKSSEVKFGPTTFF